MFERGSACRELGVVAFGFGESYAVPSILGHLGCSTQRFPDGARRHAPPNGFAGRDVAQLCNDQVIGQNLTIGLAKLGAHGIPKLGSPHERVAF